MVEDRIVKHIPIVVRICCKFPIYSRMTIYINTCIYTYIKYIYIYIFVIHTNAHCDKYLRLSELSLVSWTLFSDSSHLAIFAEGFRWCDDWGNPFLCLEYWNIMIYESIMIYYWNIGILDLLFYDWNIGSIMTLL